LTSVRPQSLYSEGGAAHDRVTATPFGAFAPESRSGRDHFPAVATSTSPGWLVLNSCRRESERSDERIEGDSALHVCPAPRRMRRHGDGQYGIHEFERRK